MKSLTMTYMTISQCMTQTSFCIIGNLIPKDTILTRSKALEIAMLSQLFLGFEPLFVRMKYLEKCQRLMVIYLLLSLPV